MLRRLRGELAAWRGVDGHLKELYRAVGDLNDFRQRTELMAEIPAVMAWIAAAELWTAPLVSVVMPTRHRTALLPRAIRSVLAQTYGNWELVIVADQDPVDPAAIVDGFDDPRLRLLHGDRSGHRAARNRGLDGARGELIAYLDDDNVMHHGWLKSVVWAFEQRSALNVLYVAIVIDDPERMRGEGDRAVPTAYLHPFDREELARRNLADMSAIAHRAGLPEARFDEAVELPPDWDLLLRLSGEDEPLALPALACFYLTDAPGRVSTGRTDESDAAQIRARLRGLDRGMLPRTGARGAIRKPDERGI